LEIGLVEKSTYFFGDRWIFPLSAKGSEKSTCVKIKQKTKQKSQKEIQKFKKFRAARALVNNNH
jgi:hypothetical protein